MTLMRAAQADTPKGTYSLGKSRPQKAELGGKKLPACGLPDTQLLMSLVPLIAEYKKGVEINREPWIVELETTDVVVASHPGHAKPPLLIQTSFWRGSKGAAGSLNLFRQDASGIPTCLVSLELSGTFTAATGKKGNSRGGARPRRIVTPRRTPSRP